MADFLRYGADAWMDEPGEPPRRIAPPPALITERLTKAVLALTEGERIIVRMTPLDPDGHPVPRVAERCCIMYRKGSEVITDAYTSWPLPGVPLGGVRMDYAGRPD